jgi:hydrogenase-4 component F
MTAVVILLLTIPAGAAIASLWLPGRVVGLVTAASGIASLVLVLAAVPAAAHRDLAWLGFLRIDALSVVFLLATAFVYACVAVYSVGYLQTSGHRGAQDRRYARRFWAGLSLFAWSMLAAPIMGNLALLWVAIEVTTIISALLVALEGTDAAAEAAWKYVLLASAGLAIALLGTIFMYYAGSRVLGPSYNLAFGPLLSVGGRLPHTAVRLAFVLAVLGFGTKVGLFPVHTWLPDAHSEAPTPVSALLSGSLLAVSFYAILRFYQIAQAALGPRLPRDVLLVSGSPRCWLLCTCSTSGTTSGCWPTPAWSTWASSRSGSVSARRSRWPGCCCTFWRMPPLRATRSWARVCCCANSASSGSLR